MDQGFARRDAERVGEEGMTQLAEEEILTSRQARRLLKIGRTKLWELTKERIIPAYRIGKARNSALRYKKADLLRWLESNRAVDNER